MQFTDREKQLQLILKSDKRFLEFLKDKDVNRKKLVDEKGRKMDIKGFVDLKRKYGLSSKDLKVEKSKQTKDPKKQKKKETSENNNNDGDDNNNNNNDDDNNNNDDDDDITMTATENANSSDMSTRDGEPTVTGTEDVRPSLATGEDKLGATARMLNKVSEATSKSKDGQLSASSFQKIKNFEISNSSETLKTVSNKMSRSKKTSPVLTRRALENFKMLMERNLRKENEDEEEVAEDKIHKEFTFTVSGPDVPASEYSDDEIDGKMKGKNRKDRVKREDDKKLSEAEKTDILLLTMDTTSVKKSTADDKNLDEVLRSKRKKTIKEEVEREVNLEDYQEILTGPRFKSLRENATFSIDEIKANAVKKRLLMKGK